jgi:RNA methyltransferase, TrmH family
MLSKNEIKDFTNLKQKKYRDKENKFLVEGFHLLEEVLKSDYHLDTVIVRKDIDLKDHQDIYTALKRNKIRIEPVPANVYDKLSETKNSQGAIGIVSQNSVSSAQGHSDSGIILALDRINDPGNLGTILRTSYCFGVNAVLLSTGSVDIFNSKVLRSSQGAHFHLKITTEVDLTKELLRLNTAGFRILLFEPDADIPLSEVSNAGKSVLVFGNEAGGISHLLLDMKYKRVKIDARSQCESLNVAVACGIALHQISMMSERKT